LEPVAGGGEAQTPHGGQNGPTGRVLEVGAGELPAVWKLREPPAEPASLELAAGEAGRFLRALFDPTDAILFHPIRDKAWRRGTGGEKHWFTIGDDELDDALAWLWKRNNLTNGGQCAFFGANPRRGHGQTGNAGVAMARAYFADFDETSLAGALGAIRGAGLPFPSIVIRSGGGVHVYWLLHDPVEDMAEWRHRQKWIAAALRSDGAVCDPNRLMRLPGFPNRKRKYAGTTPVARLLTCDPTRRFSWRDIEPRHEPEPRARVELTAEQLAALPPVPAGSMSAYSRRFLDDGVVGKAGRRMTAFHVAGDLAAREWTLEAATNAIVARLRALGLGLDELDDIPRQVANAFARPRQRIVDPGELPEPPPARVEEISTPATVPVEEIREAVAGQLARVLEERPRLAVVTAGTAASKTTAAVRLGAAQPGRVIWNVGSHAAARAVVDMHVAAGHTDVAAMPPRDETTCACWTRRDVERVAEVHGVKAGPPMQAALAVGAPIVACCRCPLWPHFKRPAGAPAPDPDLAAHAPVDDAALMAEFTAPDAMDRPAPVAELDDNAANGPCPYWERVAEAETARITVQCQQRTERRPESVAGVCGEPVALFTDENAMAVVLPRVVILPDDLDTVRDVLLAAAGNARGRIGRRGHHSHDAWKRAHAMPDWADALAGVAKRLADWARAREAEAKRDVIELPDLAVDMANVPRGATNRVLEMLARESVPEAYRPPVLELVRLVATGEAHNTTLLVDNTAGGVWLSSFHRSWSLELPPNVCHVLLDATVDVAALRRVRPDAVVLEPPGAAPVVHRAFQWWQEINKNTSPERVVAWLERVLDAIGFWRAAVILPLAHRRVLFPQTRPRGRRPAMDKPVDIKAVARWNEKRRPGDEQTRERRVAEAKQLAARVDRLRARMARDAHGNVLVDHHRGPRARGSNAFMADCGVDGLVVLGHQRTNPTDTAGLLLATGQVDAVRAGTGGWADIEGEIPHVDGTTRKVRWRGYTCLAWAAAARALNRADLVQTAARGRPNLAGGVPVVVVAAEPCGLPLADPPARMPAGVAAVVEAVRELANRAADAPGTGGERGGAGVLGNRPVGAGGGDESGQRPIRRTPVPIPIGRWPDSQGVARGAIVAAVGAPERTVKRHLAEAVSMGALVVSGAGPATRYRVPVPVELVGPPPAPVPVALATGVAEPATVDVVRWADPPAAPPPEIVPPAPSSVTPAEISPAPTPREPNTPKTATGRRPTGPKRPATTPVAPPAAGARGRDAEPTGGLPRYRFPANAPRLTGAARDAMVAELRQHLRAVAFNARMDHLAGHERDALAVDTVLALFADPPPPVARGP